MNIGVQCFNIMLLYYWISAAHINALIFSTPLNNTKNYSLPLLFYTLDIFIATTVHLV